MEGKGDGVKHSVSQSSGAVGGAGRCPWWGGDHSCHASCAGSWNQEPSG